MKHRSYFRTFAVLSIIIMLISAVGIPAIVAQAAGNTHYVDNTVLCSDSGQAPWHNPTARSQKEPRWPVRVTP